MNASRFARLGADAPPQIDRGIRHGSASVDADVARIALDPEDCQRTPCPLSHLGDPAFA